MNQEFTDHHDRAFIKHNDRYVVRIRSSVEINGVKPDDVFVLITDLRRKTLLCPHTAVIGITHHPEGAIDVGTVFHHRVAIDGRIADYHNRVIAFSPGERMVTESDSSPPFRIEVVVEPIVSGTRLTQEESFLLTELVVPVPKAPGWLGRLLRLLFGDENLIRQGSVSLEKEVEEAQSRLQPRLDAWLHRIKHHLEKKSGRFLA